MKNRYGSRTFPKYKENLSYDSSYIYSYDTKVGKIDGNKLIELGKWSSTTSKHVNYAARELGLDLVRYKSKSDLETFLNSIGITL